MWLVLILLQKSDYGDAPLGHLTFEKGFKNQMTKGRVPIITQNHFLSYYVVRGVFMIINSLILAVSSSIDSLGIGITYGIKNTKISLIARFILFIISFIISIF